MFRIILCFVGQVAVTVLVCEVWHAWIAQVPCVAYVLLITDYFVVLRFIIHLFLDAALDPLVHRGALEPLFWGSLSAEGIFGLLLGLVLRDVTRAHHVFHS